MFTNEPFTDFTLLEERERMATALAQADQLIQRGEFYACPIVNGREFREGEIFLRPDPSAPDTIVGTVYLGNEERVREALASLQGGKEKWELSAVEARATALRRAAKEMRSERFALAALIIREVGKPWAEADADVAEAIDFCDYYAEQMEFLGRPYRTMNVPGEENNALFQPRGVAAVISPWNFPLAIACGMTTAALVTGNTTVLKPAEQSSLIAFQFAKILLRAGIPPSAFAFLPGRGEVVGRALVESAEVDMICFTGSKAVGLEILRSAAEVRPGQRHIKRVVAEMGGKNAIIVDEDADLDEAVKGVLHSAFGYAGQKCSACSRVVVVGSAYEPFLKRLADGAGDLIVGESRESPTFIGPVIDSESQERILGLVDRYSSDHAVLFQGGVQRHPKADRAPTPGYFVPPTIFRDVPTDSPLWQEEIFGPVLAVRSALTFDKALQVANDSQYALTGGVFSRTPSHLERARMRFKVGNLYLNRKITGALVCRQPFGGFRLSGVGSKAGGKEYLLQFLEPRVITENTMRRGFTPQSAER